MKGIKIQPLRWKKDSTLLPQQAIIFRPGILTFRRADVETEVLIGCCAEALLLSSVSLRKSRA
jgi:hypothetical protein